jgi:FixJ family two-component response regulator
VNASTSIVFVVDDDAGVREAVSSLLRSVGADVIAVPSAQAFLDHGRRGDAGCVVLDVRMPGINGLELQQELTRSGTSPSVVFITGHGDIPMAVRAMKLGAVEFLPKPFREHELLDAVATALRRDERARSARAAVRVIRQRFDTLTDREREVLDPIVAGKLNKQVGVTLGVSEQTVKVHRHNIMRKMQAASLPDLVRMIEMLRAEPA